MLKKKVLCILRGKLILGQQQVAMMTFLLPEIRIYAIMLQILYIKQECTLLKRRILVVNLDVLPDKKKMYNK